MNTEDLLIDLKVAETKLKPCLAQIATHLINDIKDGRVLTDYDEQVANDLIERVDG